MKSFSLLRIGALALTAITLLGCTEHTLNPPKKEDMVGKYKPEDLSDKRLHPGSSIELKSNGTCHLTDFPYVDYYGPNQSQIHYYDQDGSWEISGLGSLKLVVTISGAPLEFNLLNNSPPYRIAQSGENVEFDELIFHKTP